MFRQVEAKILDGTRRLDLAFRSAREWIFCMPPIISFRWETDSFTARNSAKTAKPSPVRRTTVRHCQRNVGVLNRYPRVVLATCLTSCPRLDCTKTTFRREISRSGRSGQVCPKQWWRSMNDGAVPASTVRVGFGRPVFRSSAAQTVTTKRRSASIPMSPRRGPRRRADAAKAARASAVLRFLSCTSRDSELRRGGGKQALFVILQNRMTPQTS